MNNYFKELKSKRRIFHVGSTGLEIIINPDRDTDLPKMNKEERKDYNTQLKIENLLAKSVDNREDFNRLMGIPYAIGLNANEVFSEIIEEKLKPHDAKAKLLDLERYHALLWRG
ncbi:MAG: hypothetical protein K0R18_409 [Bacillales bacterium]|jgi:hypothetical protein|nr:hypothetical protein [Bacillales bacterium]